MPDIKEATKKEKLSRSKFLYHNDYQELQEENQLNVKTEEGIIKNVHVVTEGEAKGHFVWLNKKFIEEVVMQGKSATSGMKVRFGHPNMSSTALGTYLGRLKNFRLRQVENEFYDPDDKNSNKLKSIAIADIHLDKSAKKSPSNSPENNPYDYVLELANTNPDMFGLSIVFTNNGYEEKRKSTKNEFGEVVEFDQIKLKKLHGADVVDEPAANERLFHSGTFAESATEFLDDNPEVYDLIYENPDILNGFLQRYQEYKQFKKSKMPENVIDNVDENVVDTIEESLEETAVVENSETEVVEKTEEATEKKESYSQKVLNMLGEIKGMFSKKEDKKEVAPTVEEIEQFNTAKEEILTQLEGIKTELSNKDNEIEQLKSEISLKDSELKKYHDNEKKTVVEKVDVNSENDKSELGKLDPVTESLRNDLAGMKERLGQE